ncbi:ketoacyl-ACP synthase III family protein [Amycolatopsis sp. H20-H5]|uniref:ketoacyl-ACP synthase III family protein n=1 Tax=Amycolatopsis sp. H20-H5 TaxID=3046309 RepID=UPI002DBA0FEF|nr:ketoacyl-ACP synthase III family protein [Amycolatopsis sp. H20-H5]MEC3976326.1 ketoacyl-ACP synthase III family protein [Amycolatopsis sp. H20-H5]
MRFTSINLVGIGTEVGKLVSVRHAIETGQYEPAEAEKSAQLSTSVADLPGPRLAVRAGHKALTQAEKQLGAPLAPTCSLHAGIYYPGIDFWHAASFVRHQLGLPAGPGLNAELGAMSNSVVAGMDLAASLLAGRPDHNAVLITAGDRFGGPGFPHWNTDLGIVYGDAGSAVVLSREPGFARILSIASYTDPSLEGLQRGDEPFRMASVAAHEPLDIRRRKAEWFTSQDRSTVLSRNAAGVCEVVKTALVEAELDLPDLAKVCAPHYGRRLVDTQILRPMGIAEDQTMFALGRRVGHLGASDQVVALDFLLRNRTVGPGDHVLLLGIGVGMTWTAVVLEITGDLR